MEIYNFNSTVNQRIKGDFVRREVLACISDMAERLFDYDGEAYASYDEFSNFYRPVCSECGGHDFDIEEDDEGNTVHKCWCGQTYTDTEFADLDTEPAEIYEWWIVTPWFGDKLRDRGEVVLERWDGWIWGRQGSGQAVQLDSVVSEICYGMEILEGQAHDWSKQGVGNDRVV